jgi:hypothetical protein
VAKGFIPHCFAAIKRWPIAPIVVNNNPTYPLNQLLEADLVYVRDFIRSDNMPSEKLKHIALIAHYCYGSFDLAGKCIALLESREEVPKNCLNDYISLLAEKSV